MPSGFIIQAIAKNFRTIFFPPIYVNLNKEKVFKKKFNECSKVLVLTTIHFWCDGHSTSLSVCEV